MKHALDMVHRDLVTESNSKMDQTSENPEEKNEVNQPVARGIEVTDEQVPGPSSHIDGDVSETLAATVIGEKSFTELQKSQREDQDIGTILQAKLSNARPTSQEMVAKSPAARHYWVLWDTLEVHREVLFKRFMKKDGTAEYLQLVVPQSLKEDILFSNAQFSDFRAFGM